jgi:hypothetical protein
MSPHPIFDPLPSESLNSSSTNSRESGWQAESGQCSTTSSAGSVAKRGSLSPKSCWGASREAAGQRAKAKADLEKLYGQDPGYLDVRERLAAIA